MLSPTIQKTLIILLGLLIRNVYSHEVNDRLWRRENGIQLAERLVPAIKPRTTFYGGWSLAMAPCPSNLDDHNGACCPKNTFYFSVLVNSVTRGYACCPDAKISCGSAVAALPICADTSWVLWVNSGQYPFCCLQGEIGYETPGGVPGSLCAAGDVPVPSSIRASQMTQSATAVAAAGGTPAAATAPPSTTPSSTTPGGSPNTNTNSNSNSNSNLNSNSNSNSNDKTSVPNTSNSTGGSLSTGAIVGIAIGGAVLLIGTAVVILLVKKRKDTPNIDTIVIDPETKPPYPPNGGTATIYYPPPLPEVDGNNVARGSHRNELP